MTITEFFFSDKCLFCFFCDILDHNCFAAEKEIDNIPIFSSTMYYIHWKKVHYRRLADCGEGYFDSDINRLDPGNFLEYTTVPSQCEWLPWNWTCRILYFIQWFHFKNCPGIVKYVTCYKLLLHEGGCLWRINVLVLSGPAHPNWRK